jgi:nucleoside-diphosphate-sugar epimerase
MVPCLACSWRKKIHGRPFTVVGDGRQTRDFTYVTDVVDAFICAANSDLSGDAMNVGSSNHYSVNRLVELLGGEAIYIPKRPGEPDCTFADVRKIKKLLGWQAKVPLRRASATCSSTSMIGVTRPFGIPILSSRRRNHGFVTWERKHVKRLKQTPRT